METSTLSLMEPPPSYTPEPSLLALQQRRSIQDTRALILGNASMLKPKRRDECIELIVAKHQGDTGQRCHYAFLVTRRPGESDISIILKGKPKETVEDALEWLLERTEVLMEEILLRHAKVVDTECCFSCTKALRAEV